MAEELCDILMERIHAKLIKYNGVLHKSKMGKGVKEGKAGAQTIEVPVTSDVSFQIIIEDNYIDIDLEMTKTNKNSWQSIKNYIVYERRIEFEPSRIQFDPEKVIANIVKMYESIRLVFNMFNRHIKRIEKASGSIGGKR